MTIIYICSYCCRRWEKEYDEDQFVAVHGNIITGICRDCFKLYQKRGLGALEEQRPIFEPIGPDGKKVNPPG